MASSDNEDAVTRQLQLQPHYAYPATQQQPTALDDEDSVEKVRMQNQNQNQKKRKRNNFLIKGFFFCR
jgi:hypothetical protein